jgi:anti-sigma B factor antagonist
MKLREREENGVVILQLEGKLMGGPDATLLNEKLHQLLENGQNKVVVDLAKINWMNSSGLGMLISALTTIRNAGGDLKLASTTEKIKSLLTITKLISVFDIYSSVDEAVAALQS